MPACKNCGEAMESSTSEICPKCLLGIGVATQIDKPLEPGTTFHGLEIVQVLGRGGMGIVYKARQTQLDRFVAVKILPRAMGQNPEFAQRFNLEAKALAALSHPNIVAVHDFGREGDQFFIVMEFVDGANLRPMLAAKKITPVEALKIVPVLCEALEFAHGLGVVHRDIKPENILIDKTGRVKIADFGLAKMLSASGHQSNMTQTHVAMGTPQYMAPEQFESAKSVDHRADIYSMGVLFYEMLTGELPMGRFDPPSVRKIEVDVRLDEIVLRALEKEPAKRYQTMGEVRRDITRVSSIAPSGRRPSRSSSNALPWTIAAASLVIAAAVLLKGNGAAPVTAPAAPPTGTQAAVDTPPATRTPAELWALATVKPNELPTGWHITESEEAADRTEVLKFARWWRMDEQAKFIDNARRIGLENAQKHKITLLAYNCRDRDGLNDCLKFMTKENLPQWNHFLVEKGNLFIVGGGEKIGIISPDVQALEDTLRVKLGAPPAKRTDLSAIAPEQVPEGWIELKKSFSGKSTPVSAPDKFGIPNLMEAFQYVPSPELDKFWKGWVRSFGDPAQGGAHADILSLRFFETADARAYLKEARMIDPPKGSQLRIFHDDDYVVCALFSGSDPAHERQFMAFRKAIVEKLGWTSDDINAEAKVATAEMTDAAVNLTVDFTSVNSAELRRAGTWKIQETWRSTSAPKAQSDWSVTCEPELELKVPEALAFTNGKWRTSLSLPIPPEVKELTNATAKSLSVRITWDGKDKSVDVFARFPPLKDKEEE